MRLACFMNQHNHLLSQFKRVISQVIFIVEEEVEQIGYSTAHVQITPQSTILERF